MGERVQCFWIEPTSRGHRSLRRYSWGRDDAATMNCTGGYHNASVLIDEDVPIVRTPAGYISETMQEPVAHEDPRWPTQCAHCEYQFVPSDHWQVNHDEAWVRTDTGAVASFGLMTAPPGAMWHAFWMGDFYRGRGPDGLLLTVQLPDGLAWMVDGPSRDAGGSPGPGWTRIGDPRAIPPTVSALPSILTEKYHGFLTNGVLIEV